MIKLDIAEYCHDCRAFEPVVDTVYSNDMSSSIKTIKCENSHKCEVMIRYLLRQQKVGNVYASDS